MNVDQNLSKWDELLLINARWENLLLGNGFSTNVWHKFSYDSLYALAQKEEIGEKLTVQSIALFDHLLSSNFEDVLRVLHHAILVDEQLDSPQRDRINELYKNTKNALSASVNFSHLPPGQANMQEISSQLAPFSKIFTTNYDLIIYWAIMSHNTDHFRDLFWGQENSFNIGNAGVMARKSAIYYLHGAIHLVELEDGTTRKLTVNGDATLADLFDLKHPEKFPLFVSEGSSEWKLSKIRRNDYLRHAYERLCDARGNLVVLGHSLHKNYDQHIIDAIKRSPIECVAISVWPEQTPPEIISFKARLLEEFHMKQLLFFDSKSHPLTSSELRVH
ncbi:DUF4917 family protein [Herminiimonas aquatilis]|uniref:DUF4917 family protein n=1 Tax=Herminiimonas aquatilis TaxID=345342 RepID=A0ABW2J401_9BURK